MKIKCENCNKSVNKHPSDLMRSLHHFCSRRCAAIINNKKFPKKKCKKRNICKYCGAKKAPANKSFCSIRHSQQYHREKRLSLWLSGKASLGKNCEGKLPVYARNYLIDKNNNACIKCGWSKKHSVTGLFPLQIHHKDGNCLNNKIKNLEVLCPNCHALTNTYGSLNPNTSGRKSRRSVE